MQVLHIPDNSVYLVLQENHGWKLLTKITDIMCGMIIINQCVMVMVNVLMERVMLLEGAFVQMTMKDRTVIKKRQESKVK